METAIDGAGRIVVPSALRKAMGLTAGQRLDIALVDGRLEIAVQVTPATVEIQDGWPSIVADIDEALTDDDVRRALEETRR